MWNFWILICAACFANSLAYNTDYVNLEHGDQLSIKMPGTRTDALEFTPVDESQTVNLWPRSSGYRRGFVSGLGDTRRFIISSVNFDDQGTYTQHNIWSKVTHVTKVKINPKRYVSKCVPGETLLISLVGLVKDDVSLSFSSEDENLRLVQRGSPVGNLLDFIGRIKVTDSNIKVLNVNVSDVGNYTLYDGKDRTAAIVRLKLVDHHEGINASPFVSFLLFLGIPVGVCYCCRRRICKRNSQPTARTVVQTENTLHPEGPPPVYNYSVAPAGPNPMYNPVYPAPGENKVHPPPNPAYPQQPQYSGQPAMPPNPGYNAEYNQQIPVYPPASGGPPVQPPQWTGPPPDPSASAMYAPGYPAPGTSMVHPPPPNPLFPPQPQYSGQPAVVPSPGFAPMMYNAPPGEESKGDIKMNEMSPATPLLGPSQPQVGPPAPYSATDVLNNSDSTVQFNIDTGKGSSYNFL